MESIIAAIISLISKFVGNDKNSNQGGTTIIHNHHYGEGRSGQSPQPIKPQPTPDNSTREREGCMGIGCLTLIIIFVVGTCLRTKDRELPISNVPVTKNNSGNKSLNYEEMIIGAWDFQYGFTDDFNQRLLGIDSLCLVFDKGGKVIRKQFNKNGTKGEAEGTWRFKGQIFYADFKDGITMFTNDGDLVVHRQLKGMYTNEIGGLKFTAIKKDLMGETGRNWENIDNFLHNEKHIKMKNEFKDAGHKSTD